ncbi:MAG: hypothetical protein WKF73_12315 [Nocardioidaceae bacterium]
MSGDGGSELITTRLNIVPRRGRPWQRQFEGGDRYIDLVTVARDASVIIGEVDTSRWTKASRSFTTIPAWFRDANEQGDALLGGGIYGGPLRLWQVGKAPGAESPSPAGKTYASVLTADQRVYVAQRLDSRRAHYYLKIRQF